MRAFLALLPPPELTEHLEEFVAPRRDADPGLRWAGDEQFHLTLAFLPDLAEVDVDPLMDRLRALGTERDPIDLRLRGGGAFPDAAGAKVLWIGAQELDGSDAADAPVEVSERYERDEPGATPRLDRLARNARNAAAVSGTVVDGTRFTPHVTLARYGRATDATRWLRVLDAYAGPRWHADEVALVQSRLGQGRHGRPAYDVLDTASLRGLSGGRA